MLRNRPAAFLCLIFSAGMAAGLFLKYWAIAVFVVPFAVLFICKKGFRKRFILLLLTFAALLCGTVYAVLHTAFTKPPTPESNKDYCFTAAVKSVSVYSDSIRAELDIQDESCVLNGHSAYMYLSSCTLEPCDVVKVYASVTESSVRAKSNGVDYVAYGRYELQADKRPEGWYYSIIAFRQKVGNRIEATFNGEAAGFYRALITGDRSKVSLEVNASFSRSGILHILAVSGQHFSIIIIGLYRFLMAVFKHKKACSGIALGAALLYTLFTGFSPSVTRAAFMCCAIFSANIFKEKSDSLINLSAVLVILLLYRPYSIINPSLLLSFIATVGIILTLDQLDRFYSKSKVKKAFKWLITPAALSVSTSLFCMPVYLLGFDYVSLCAPITNIFANALVGPAMVCAIAALPFDMIGIGFIAEIGELLFEIIRYISDTAAGFRFSCISLHTPHIWLLVLPSIATAIAYAALYVRKGLKVLVLSAVSMVLICLCCHGFMLNGYKNAPLLYISDSVRDCYAFYADNESFVLIDGGGNSGAANGAMINGCTHLSDYVVTDCTDSALLRLKKTLPYTPAETVYIPESNSDTAAEIIDYCKSNGCEIKLYSKSKGLFLADICVYGGNSEETESAFLIKGAVESGTVAVFGRGEGITKDVWEGCDTLVITRACTNSPCDPNLLPLSCNKAYVYKNDKSFLTSYIKNTETANEIKPYSNSLLLRFGNTEVYEVKADE